VTSICRGGTWRARPPALAPADVENVTVSALGTAYVEVSEDDRGLAIGSSGKRIRLARLLASEYAGLDDVALT